MSAPASIYDLFANRPKTASTPFGPISVRSGEGTRYAQKALADEANRVATAPEGTRNDTLNRAAFSISQLVSAGHIQAQTAWDTLHDAARRAGLPTHEIEQTLQSGYTGAQRKPRTNAPTPEESDSWLPDDINPATTLPEQFDTPSSAPSPVGSDATTGPSSETSAPNATDAEPSEPDPTQLEEWRKARLAQEIEEQRIRREARRLVSAEEAAANWREPAWFSTLTEELQQPDEPVTYLVDEIVPTGANVLLTAQYKTGKTTLINNLTKALADGEPFLNRFDTNQTEGRIAIWNYEVDERQYRRWLRELNITNTDKVTVLNLRGYRMPVIHEQIEEWMTTWLRRHEITTWIMDPFARAFVGSGTSENDNTEVGTFLDTLDVIKHEAGVSELILPTHTGRGDQEKGAERARGATRLDDWADVRWLLVKDEHDARFFRATGRDVDFEEEKLDFNHDTRELTLAGGDRAWEKRRREQKAVVDVVAANPGIGLLGLRKELRQQGVKGRNEKLDSIVQNAIFEGDLRTETAGTGQAIKHYANRVATLPDGA